MSIISDMLNIILNYIFALTSDWGITIALLTVMVRILLLPLSIKQKKSILQQQALSRKIEKLKIKYKDNKEKLENEMQKVYQQNAKGMLGCFVSLIQLPVVISLYALFISMPVEAGTILIPWVASIKMSDQYYIVPVLYTLVSLSPQLFSFIPYLKTAGQGKISKANIMITGFLSMLITFKAPLAVAIYFLTTGLFSMLEELFYRLYLKRSTAKSM